MRAYLRRAAAAGPARGVEAGELLAWFDLTGAQRLLKVAGIFARLYHRDGKARYLADLPRTLSHLRGACAALPELRPLAALLDRLAVERRLAERGAAPAGGGPAGASPARSAPAGPLAPDADAEGGAPRPHRPGADRCVR